MGLKNEENFKKKCRLCGRLGRRFTDIFTPTLPSTETKPNKKLCQLIYKCLQLQVKEDDGLPKKICDDCNKKLAAWQNFHRKCEQTQKRLQQYLENWQKSSICVPSSSEHIVTFSVGVGSNSYSTLSQVSLVDKIPTEKTQAEIPVLQKKAKDVLSLNSSTEDNLPVGPNSLNDEEKHEKNTFKANNAKGGKVKLKKSGSQKKISYPAGNDNSGQAHVTTIAKENEQPQKHLTAGSLDCIKSIPLPKSSSKTKKSVEVHQCHICNKTFSSHRKLNVHIAVHLSLPEFQCDECSKKFRSKFSLRSHLETHSASRNYCCHLCGRLFHTASGLCNHVKLHSDETKRFTCPLCGKQFRQAGHLEQHQRTHTGERPHHCTECEQRFTTRCQLSRHVQGVHRCAKKHKCLVCDKEFLYSTNFKAHLLRHAGQRNNKCGECGKMFVTSNALFRHRRFHTGDKPFECNICGKKFADCSNRKRHMLRHLQQPVIPRGRRSGPRPKLARVISLRDTPYTQQGQSPSSKEVQPFDGQEGAVVYNKLVQFSVPPATGSSQAEGNGTPNHSQGAQVSGEVVKSRRNSRVALGSLAKVGVSQSLPQLNVISTNSQLPSCNNFITDSSNIYVSVSSGLPQLIQLSPQNANLLIQPLAHDSIQGLQSSGMERQCVDKLNASLKDKLDHSGHNQKHTTKINSSALCAWNVIDEDSVKKNGNVSTDSSDKAKLYRTEEDNRDTEVDRPKTYANLRTFLESSEIVETLSGGKNDEVGDSGNGLVNVEYVTLMANDGNEASFTSGVQEVIVLPHETKISDYDLSKNVGKFQMVVKGNETSSDRESTFRAQQVGKEYTKSVNVAAEAVQSSQNRNIRSRLCHTSDKGKMTERALQTPSTKCDSVIEIFLSSTDGNKFPRSTEGISDKVQNETLDSANLIQVLLESDGNNTTQQENTDKNQQTFLVSSDVFSDEDAIIRMLNSQGTVMLSTTQTEFTDVTRLIGGSGEVVGMTVSKDPTSSVLDFRSFANVGDTIISETAGKKGENNGKISLMSSDYSHEISLTTAVTLDNSDVNVMVRKRMSEDEAGGLQASDQNEITSGNADDIEMFELCSEDLTKLAPVYQVYQTCKMLDN